MGNKIALVTGGRGGLGGNTVLSLARRGMGKQPIERS
jgi:NAD(P)-dependent dehydrogenase (short-subunit alcohol dehydrogenase family)